MRRINCEKMAASMENRREVAVQTVLAVLGLSHRFRIEDTFLCGCAGIVDVRVDQNCRNVLSLGISAITEVLVDDISRRCI